MASIPQESTSGDNPQLLEQWLKDTLATALSNTTPSPLRQAIERAVFPAGSRLRPRLCLNVFYACGARYPQLAQAAAIAIELLHCASLVQDDLPCFDNAPLRRGMPTIHREFSESIAVLTSDALIVMAFAVLSKQIMTEPKVAAEVIAVVARAVGANEGLIAGQAMESLPTVSITAYHQCKTASLFVAAVTCGALSGGADPQAWIRLGKRLGQLYQIADDIADLLGSADQLGKEPDRDRLIQRPNIAHHDLHAAARQFTQLLDHITEDIPLCHNREMLVNWLRQTLLEGKVCQLVAERLSRGV